MDYRSPANDYGLHRTLEPEGALPQAAKRLDNSSPPFVNEIAIDVERLNIDSASLHQLVDEVGRDSEAVGERIVEIVDERGKMQNPVTGSGGMLLGTIGAVGDDYDGPIELVVGDRVATLVSLTLTPLELSRVRSVDFEMDQVAVDGRAYLWPSSPVVSMPEDIDEPVALAIFDVCGAPPRTRRLVDGAESVLIIGVGTSGMLCAAAAREEMGPDGEVWAVDRRREPMASLADEGIVDDCREVDAQRPVEVMRAVEAMSGQPEVDVVVNTCNVPGTEMAAILPCRQGGSVYFFNMATSFSRAALGAEGVGKDVDLLVGNGYAAGHAEYTLGVVREYPVVRERIESLVAAGDGEQGTGNGEQGMGRGTSESE